MTRANGNGISRKGFLGGLGLAAATLALGRRAAAQAHGHAATGAASPFAEANARMHAGMDIAWTGNPDLDFARAMIPHHRGAIDMVRIEVEQGTDPVLRQVAEEIIGAQEAEIAFLEAWLERNGG